MGGGVGKLKQQQVKQYSQDSSFRIDTSIIQQQQRVQSINSDDSESQMNQYECDGSDIEEECVKPLPYERLFQGDLQIDDDQTKKVRQRMSTIKDYASEGHSQLTDDDLQFLDQIELDDLLKSTQMNQQQFNCGDKTKQIYIRTIQTIDWPNVGQQKKVKFDSKQQNQSHDIFEQEQSYNSDQYIEENVVINPQQYLAEIGVAVECRKGNKKEGPHQNDYFIYNDLYHKIYALVNAHGEFGHFVSNLTYRLLFSSLIRNPLFYTDPKTALLKTLEWLQDEVCCSIEKKSQNCVLSGCVITVIVQKENKLIIGHIGDNRSTVYKEVQHNRNKQVIADLTPIHCPLDLQEKARIFTSGGEVRRNQMDEYVYVQGRLYPQMQVTRSIGDLIGHMIGVTSVPYVNEYEITPDDAFLVISTLPTFVYMEQEEISNHLTGFTLRNIRQACESLYKRAKSSQIVCGGVFDDMTIILVWLGSFKDQKCPQ